jgi:flavin reductase (DIM6/NTAB) family NADH-FMN oxidoreductase RutF
MEINPASLPHRDVYKLMIGSIVPRPIAWVSTISPDGVPNLAPFSFFTGVCSNPPTVVFCPGIREVDRAQKDTLNNVQTTGVFIINFVSESLAAAMNSTAVEAPPEVNEFERAGLASEPGMVVPVPRVAASLIHYECRLQQIIPISAEPGGGNLVIGTVVHMHFADSVYREGNRIDLGEYQPVGRLAGASYCRVQDVFDLSRPPSEIKTTGG